MFDGRNAVVIDRNFPENLIDHMSNPDWIHFCDHVDALLEPMNGLKKTKNTAAVFLRVGLFMASSAILGVIVFTLRSQLRLNPALATVVIIVIILTPLWFSRRYVSRVSREASNTISDVDRALKNYCVTESEKWSGITFLAKSKMSRAGIPSVKFEIDYIVRPDSEVGLVTNAFPVEASPVLTSVVLEAPLVEDPPAPSAPPKE